MIENRQKWLDTLLSKEVEGGFVNDPHDSGGATNLGITQATLAAWRKQPVTVEDVKALTLKEAEGIALGAYWEPVRGDFLPGGLDVMVADAAFHSGPGTAAKLLQRIVEVPVDSHVGEVTVAACRAHPDTATLIESYHNARLAYLRSLGDKWERYGKGWTNRCNRMRALALSLVQPNIVEAGLPKSRIVWGSLSGLAASIAVLATALPEIIAAGQRAHQAVSTGDIVQMAIGIAGAVGTIAAIYARVSDYRRGLHVGRTPA